jgi:hypothetical protein
VTSQATLPKQTIRAGYGSEIIVRSVVVGADGKFYIRFKGEMEEVVRPTGSLVYGAGDWLVKRIYF